MRNDDMNILFKTPLFVISLRQHVRNVRYAWFTFNSWLCIQICGLYLPGNSGDFRGALSARLFGGPQDCLSPRNNTVFFTSYVEMKLHWGGHFLKFYMKTTTKMKKKLDAEIIKTCNLSNESICRPPQSRETVPLIVLEYIRCTKRKDADKKL